MPHRLRPATPSSERGPGWARRQRGAAGVLRRALLRASLGLIAGACAPSDAHPRAAGLAIERLAFVPKGRLEVTLPGSGLQVFEVREALLVDMFEVTRGEWLDFARTRANDPELAEFTARWSASSSNWPASYVTEREAEEFARARGMRLPTAGEWLVAAVGPQRLAYPWGSTAQRSIANTLELGLDRTAPVGTFEAGRTSLYLYDMLGNVAEWTSDLAPTAETLAFDGRVSVLGGSYRNLSRPIFDLRATEGQSALLARAFARESRADDVGFRCCADAQTYLWEHAGEFDDGEATQRRLVAVGRRWGRRAVPLLEALAARPNAARAFAALAEGARR